MGFAAGKLVGDKEGARIALARRGKLGRDTPAASFGTVDVRD